MPWRVLVNDREYQLVTVTKWSPRAPMAASVREAAHRSFCVADVTGAASRRDRGIAMPEPHGGGALRDRVGGRGRLGLGRGAGKHDRRAPAKKFPVIIAVLRRASMMWTLVCSVLVALLVMLSSRATVLAQSSGCSTYLGRVSANPFAWDSISNRSGVYGSPYSARSVMNPFGRYGSPYSAASATNPYGSLRSPRLYGADGRYLGRVNDNPYDPESIANPYGQYGSPFSPASINNPYGQYGNPYSAQSATNPYATQAPRMYGC